MTLLKTSPKNVEDEIDPKQLKAALGKKVDALAFGLSYQGILKKIDLKAGTIKIEDKEDYAVLEIERIESFKVLSR